MKKICWNCKKEITPLVPSRLGSHGYCPHCYATQDRFTVVQHFLKFLTARAGGLLKKEAA